MLLVVRSLKDLHANAAIIREVVDRLEPSAGKLLGVWCDPDAVLHPPETVPVRLADGVFRSLRFHHSFELAGIWAVWCLEKADGFTAETTTTSHDVIARALLSTKRQLERQLYVPVFDAGHAPAQVAAEMHQLVSAHPQRIGPPLYHDRRGGRLMWSRQPTGEAGQ